MEISTKLPSWSELQNYHNTFVENSYNAFVGWANTSDENCVLSFLLSKSNISTLSKIITESLDGVDPLGRRLQVSDEMIASVLSTIYRSATRTQIGDIHSRYIIPQEQSRCDARTICNQTIQVIVSTIRNEMETTENNKKLSIWNTLYGDFNKEGLRAHAPIKIRRKHPQYMAFNMNY